MQWMSGSIDAAKNIWQSERSKDQNKRRRREEGWKKGGREGGKKRMKGRRMREGGRKERMEVGSKRRKKWKREEKRQDEKREKGEIKRKRESRRRERGTEEGQNRGQSARARRRDEATGRSLATPGRTRGAPVSWRKRSRRRRRGGPSWGYVFCWYIFMIGSDSAGTIITCVFLFLSFFWFGRLRWQI